jgi:hypothetical protein
VQNAKKGGQGGSKRRVGSRGLDKIVQIPVGTVVHLVTGSLPCLEQKPSVLPDQSSWEPWRLSSPSDVGPSATVADETQISSAAWLESLCLDSGRRRIIKSAYAADAVEEQGLREQEEGSSDGSIILETACESEGCVEDADLLEDPDLDSILALSLSISLLLTSLLCCSLLPSSEVLSHRCVDFEVAFFPPAFYSGPRFFRQFLYFPFLFSY